MKVELVKLANGGDETTEDTTWEEVTWAVSVGLEITRLCSEVVVILGLGGDAVIVDMGSVVVPSTQTNDDDIC